VKRVVPQSWGTSNGTFLTDRVGDVEISFVEYLASKKVCLQLDIVEYSPGDQVLMYDIRRTKQDDIYGPSNIILQCSGS
jgi:hypothetical protein